MVQRVGIIGGGQLAWMMAAGAKKLGIALLVQTPSSTDPAVGIATGVVMAAIADATATAQLAAQCDVITFENEFVDLPALARLEEQGICFRPSTRSLAPLLDKYHQRQFLQELGLPTPTFSALDAAAAERASLPTDFPVVLKTRRHGYDGQGTFILKTQEEFQATLHRLQGVPLLLEEFIPFERELAVIAARSITGEIIVYPLVVTQQEQQVCRRVFAPAAVSPVVVTQAEAIARTLLEQLQVVGVFAIELFLTADAKVYVNEIAPRVHNSGHFTLDACATSQFEQHLRAVAGLPLGDSTMVAPAVMVNLLGYESSTSHYQEKRQQLATIPHAHVHWYGKTESRPGRKLGHVTVLLEGNSTEGEMTAIAQQIEAIWYSETID